MAARLSRLLVALGLLLGAALPSAVAAVVRLPTSHESATSLVPDRGVDAANARSYFGARYYRANLGRFTTVDPELNVKEALVDPQRWNRYAYVRNNPLRYIDPDGRSSIVFNGALQMLFFSNKAGDLIGSWKAANRVDPRDSIGRLEDGVLTFEDTKTPRGFGDESPNSRLGSYGIFVLSPFVGPDDVVHTGVGVHSGREDRGGFSYWTNGCIRTTDEAMKTIAEAVPKDPLTTIAILDNRVPKQQSLVMTQLARMMVPFGLPLPDAQ